MSGRDEMSSPKVGKLPIKVLCMFRYLSREGGISKWHPDAVMIRATTSKRVMEQFVIAMCKSYRARIREYEFVGYISENGKKIW